MKTCPVCGARAFDDAETCFGCLHRFGDCVDEAYLPDWYPAAKTQPIAKAPQAKRQSEDAGPSFQSIASRPSGNSAAAASAAASAAPADSTKPQSRSALQEDLFSFTFEPDGVEEAPFGGREVPGRCESGSSAPIAADVPVAAIVADPKAMVPGGREEAAPDRADDRAACAASRSSVFAPSDVALSFPMRGEGGADGWTVVVEWLTPSGVSKEGAPSAPVAPMASGLSCGMRACEWDQNEEDAFDQALSGGIVVRVRPSRGVFRLRAGSVRGCHARVVEGACQNVEALVRDDESPEA